MKVSAIIAAAGSGSRTGLPYNKVFYDMGGVPMITRSVEPFLSIESVEKIVVTANACDMPEMARALASVSTDKPIEIVAGGSTRGESVLNALEKVDTPFVAIHDGARPFVTRELILACLLKAEIHGAAIPVVPLKDTIKKVGSEFVEFTPLREDFKAVQTPQVFPTEKLRKSYMNAACGFTDDSAVYEYAGGCVFTVEGDPENVKITDAEDLSRIPLHLCRLGDTETPLPFRVGTGFDAHKLVEGRRLVLGGVTIPHYLGLEGHSDADALAHAVTDAILAAAGLRDIGCYFPDTDKEFKDANSLKLLEKVCEIVENKGFFIGNISAVIMAQKPKLAQYIPEMAKNIAKAAGTEAKNVGISATTTEKLGIIGEEKGIACQAVASVFAKAR